MNNETALQNHASSVGVSATVVKVPAGGYEITFACNVVRAKTFQKAKEMIDAAAVTFSLAIENLKDGFRAHGYVVRAYPIPGHEAEYAQELRAGLAKIDRALEFINKQYRTRGKSKRALAMLHQDLPEPIWGVSVRSAG